MLNQDRHTKFARTHMKKGSTIFLQVIIVLIGIGALAFMLWEPHVEGVNAHAAVEGAIRRWPIPPSTAACR